MDRARIDAWIRFYDEVVIAGGDWPAEAWFAAVGDALAAALPADSQLLDLYREKVRHLLAQEQKQDAGAEEARRLAELEREIQRLIGNADEAIRSSGQSGAGEGRSGNHLVKAPFIPRTQTGGLARATLQTVLGLVVIGAGLLGALYLYDSRLTLRVAKEIEHYVGGVRASVSDLERQLAQQIMEQRAEQVRLEQQRSELEAGMATISDRMNEQMAAMVDLREAAMADLEQRLDEESGEVVQMLDRLQERGVTLNEGLDAVNGDLRNLQRQVPVISEALTRLSDQAEQGRAAFAETLERVAALQSIAPELATMAEEERSRLEEVVAQERARLGNLAEQIGALQERFEESGSRLEEVHGRVDTSLALAEADRDRLQAAIREIEGADEALAEIKGSAEAEIGRLRQEMQQQMNQLLAEMAKKAELAMLRGDDVLARTLRDAEQRVDVAADDAVGTLGAARERELATLTQNVAAGRLELDRTRQAIVEGWQRMDELAARRQAELLRELEGYGDAMAARVEALLDELGVELASNQAAR